MSEVICPNCGGRGYYSEEGCEGDECISCDGSGRIKTEEQAMPKQLGEFRHCKCGCYTNALPEFCSGCNKAKESFEEVRELTEEEKAKAANVPEFPPETFDESPPERLWTPMSLEEIEQAADEVYPPSEEEVDRLGDDLSPEELKKVATTLRQEVWASALKRMKESGEVKITVHRPRNYRSSSQEPNMSNSYPDIDKINEQANALLEDHLSYMSRSGTFSPVRADDNKEGESDNEIKEQIL